MFWCTILYVYSSFAIILMGKRELVALRGLSSWCLVMVVWLFCLSAVCDCGISWSYSLILPVPGVCREHYVQWICQSIKQSHTPIETCQNWLWSNKLWSFYIMLKGLSQWHHLYVPKIAKGTTKLNETMASCLDWKLKMTLICNSYFGQYNKCTHQSY